VKGEASLPGKVFVSCGQRAPNETRAADAVKRLLSEKFQLTPYVAFRVQSLGDIMRITDELRSSDYYLLIDFKRRQKKPEDLPCSLFTHQEVALAQHLGFREQIIALQQKGAPLEGFLRYLQSNPTSFKTISDLLEKVQVLVDKKGWNANYSRNLVVSKLTKSPLFGYGDHTGGSRYNVAWKAKIDNRRSDAAAVGAVCILDTINGDPCEDRAHLKWADQASYEPTLLPQDFGQVTLFTVRPNAPGLFLQSLHDHAPREPIVKANGDYDLAFKVFARDFPLLQFNVTVRLRWQPTAPNTWTTWETQTEAELRT
jgi:hypothetical protein